MNPATREATVVREHGGEVLRAFGEQITVKLSTEQTQGALALWEELTPPGGGPPLHYHLNEEELFIVQEGQVQFFLDGEWSELGPGGVVFIPRGVVHTFRNAGERPTRQWVLATPSGFEQFMARCAGEFAQANGPDMARIGQISAEHGIHFIKTPEPG